MKRIILMITFLLVLPIASYKMGVRYGKMEIQHKVYVNQVASPYMTTTCGQLTEDKPNLDLIEKGIKAECFVRKQMQGGIM